MSIVDYLYLSQLPPLLFATDAWQDARRRLGSAPDGKHRLQSTVGQIAPVRNEIAHVREVDRDRLLRASVACNDVLEMLQDLSRERVLHGTTQFAAKIADSMVRTRTLYAPRNEKYVRSFGGKFPLKLSRIAGNAIRNWYN